MENYEKGETVEEEVDHRAHFRDVESLPVDLFVMKIRGGSKIQDIIEVVLTSMTDSTATGKRSVVFFGAGPAISKTISCAEILKRRVKELHQVTNIGFQEVREVWNPKLEGMNVLNVSRKVPIIHILLSKDPIKYALDIHNKTA